VDIARPCFHAGLFAAITFGWLRVRFSLAALTGGKTPQINFVMFINISNHPTSKWGDEQLLAAQEFGELLDKKFPNILPHASAEDVQAMAADMAEEVTENGTNAVVHVMGEMGYTHALVTLLKAAGVRCFHSTTERKVTENLDGSKTVVFEFVQFRSY
jgi:hypothetical protein